MEKSSEKWGKVGKSGGNGEKLESSEKLDKMGKGGVKWFFLFFEQNGRRQPFWMSGNNFRSQFLPFQIDTQLFFFEIFGQNGLQRPRYLDE